MIKDSITGKNYSETKVVITLSDMKTIIILSDKFSRREVINDIFDYIESEYKAGRLNSKHINEIKFLDNPIIELN